MGPGGERKEPRCFSSQDYYAAPVELQDSSRWGFFWEEWLGQQHLEPDATIFWAPQNSVKVFKILTILIDMCISFLF